jgi:hypothetical protein
MRSVARTSIVFAFVFAALARGDASRPEGPPALWKLDKLAQIGGHVTTVLGNPKLIDAPGEKAILFDGVDDGLVVDANPVAGWQSFTVEAIFRPDAGGSKEQRWLHIQGDTRDDRVLLEIRVDGEQWFLDTFIKSGESSRALYAENFKHPLGQWYHVALVFDGATMKHYVDGKEELSGPLTITPLDKGKTSLGVRTNRVYWFKGAISRARFTARALSSKEFMKKN